MALAPPASRDEIVGDLGGQTIVQQPPARRVSLGLEFAAGRVKPLHGFARGRTWITRSPCCLGRERRIGSGEACMERPGKSRGRIAGNLGGVDMNGDNIADIRRSRSRSRAAQILNRLNKFR